MEWITLICMTQKEQSLFKNRSEKSPSPLVGLGHKYIENRFLFYMQSVQWMIG